HVVADDLCSALERLEIVPLRLVLPVALRILVTVAGRQGKTGHHRPAARRTNLRVFAHITKQDHLVDALCHVRALSPVRCRRLSSRVLSAGQKPCVQTSVSSISRRSEKV